MEAGLSLLLVQRAISALGSGNAFASGSWDQTGRELDERGNRLNILAEIRRERLAIEGPLLIGGRECVG